MSTTNKTREQLKADALVYLAKMRAIREQILLINSKVANPIFYYLNEPRMRQLKNEKDFLKIDRNRHTIRYMECLIAMGIIKTENELEQSFVRFVPARKMDKIFRGELKKFLNYHRNNDIQKIYDELRQKNAI